MNRALLLVAFLCSLNLSFGQSKRIVNGKDAKLSSFPWSVSLQFYVDSEPMGHLCGGAIISKRIILTAAHCLDLPDNYRIEVHGGGNGKQSQLKKLAKIKKSFIHPKYQLVDPDGIFNIKNDIGVIFLESDIKFSKSVQPIKLIGFRDDLNQLRKGRLGIAGWGRTVPPSLTKKIFKGPFFIRKSREDDDLQLQYSSRVIGMPLSDSSFWKFKKNRDRFLPIDEDFGDYARRSFSSGDFILTQGFKGVSACNGDSGSMLFKRILGSKYKYKAIGIASFLTRQPFCRAGGVAYTNIQNYLGWIRSLHRRMNKGSL